MASAAAGGMQQSVISIGTAQGTENGASQLAAELHPEVVALLTRIYQRASNSESSSKALVFGDTQRLLSVPPRLTTIRINPLKLTREKAKAAIEYHFHKLNETVVMTPHPELIDILTVPVTGPHPITASGKTVLVDRTCGSAVLRGAPVFAAGVVSADQTISPGDSVSVWIALTASDETPSNQTTKATDSKSLDSSSPPPQQRVLIGSGASLLSADAMNNKTWKRPAATESGGSSGGAAAAASGSTAVGVRAVQLNEVLYKSPSFYALERGCTCGCGITTPGTVLIQNLPSALAALALGITSTATSCGERVLDMCAAPGGKTTHIASLLSLKQSVASGGDSKFTAQSDVAGRNVLVAFESNPLRCASLKRLLSDWTTASDSREFTSPSVHVIGADSLSALDASDSKKSFDPTSGSFAPASFDRILLDPPCSGLGQRPHFSAGGQTVSALRGRAMYQRKLMTIAYQLLRPVRTVSSVDVKSSSGADVDSSDTGGVLVYSTCTLSVFENESNVAWFLKTYPDMKLMYVATSRHSHL